MTVTKQMGMMIMLRSRSVCRTDPLRLDAEMVLFSLLLLLTIIIIVAVMVVVSHCTLSSSDPLLLSI